MASRRTKESHVPPPITVAHEIYDEPPLVPDEPQAIPAEEYALDEHGRYIATSGSRELFIYVGGRRYEHVAETAEGRWVYQKS